MPLPNSRRVPGKRKTLTRAKVIDAETLDYVLSRVARSENALRDRAMLLLSFDAALRAKEIAGLQWKKHILDSRGRVDTHLWVSKDVGKKSTERYIQMSDRLREALIELHEARPKDKFVIHPLASRRAVGEGEHEEQIGVNALIQYFKRLFAGVGLDGCTSHSGRRTFITDGALNAGRGDYTLKDVQRLAGHRKLETTAGYIDAVANDSVLVNRRFAA